MNRQKIMFTTATVLNALASISPEEAEQVLKNVRMTLDGYIKGPEPMVQPVKTYTIKFKSLKELANECLVMLAVNTVRDVLNLGQEDARCIVEGSFKGNEVLLFRSHETETNEAHFSRLVDIALSLNARFRGKDPQLKNYNFCEVVEVTV